MATTDAEVARKPEFKVAVFPRESIRLPPGLIVHPLLRSFEESRRNCAELYAQTTSAALRTVGATESATSENERAKAKEAAISAIQLAGMTVGDRFAEAVAKTIASYSRPTTLKYEYHISRLIREINSLDPELIQAKLGNIEKLSSAPEIGINEGKALFKEAKRNFREALKQHIEQEVNDLSKELSTLSAFLGLLSRRRPRRTIQEDPASPTSEVQKEKDKEPGSEFYG